MRKLQTWYHPWYTHYPEVVMPLLVLLIAAALLIVGAVQLIEGAIVFGLILLGAGLVTLYYGRGRGRDW
jgi:uncharacterized membrane protein